MARSSRRRVPPPRASSATGGRFRGPTHGLDVRWVVEDFIGRLPDQTAQTAAIRRLFDLAQTLSQRMQLIHTFGTWPDIDRRRREDQPAASAEVTAELEARLIDQIY